MEQIPFYMYNRNFSKGNCSNWRAWCVLSCVYHIFLADLYIFFWSPNINGRKMKVILSWTHDKKFQSLHTNMPTENQGDISKVVSSSERVCNEMFSCHCWGSRKTFLLQLEVLQVGKLSPESWCQQSCDKSLPPLETEPCSLHLCGARTSRQE